jgi:hypothetical protein
MQTIVGQKRCGRGGGYTKLLAERVVLVAALALVLILAERLGGESAHPPCLAVGCWLLAVQTPHVVY